jgi:hypothetical protein
MKYLSYLFSLVKGAIETFFPFTWESTWEEIWYSDLLLIVIQVTHSAPCRNPVFLRFCFAVLTVLRYFLNSREPLHVKTFITIGCN